MEDETLKEERKKASHWGVFLGGIVLIAGAIICLIYLLIFKPWKMGLQGE